MATASCSPGPGALSSGLGGERRVLGVSIADFLTPVFMVFAELCTQSQPTVQVSDSTNCIKHMFISKQTPTILQWPQFLSRGYVQLWGGAQTLSPSQPLLFLFHIDLLWNTFCFYHSDKSETQLHKDTRSQSYADTMTYFK